MADKDELIVHVPITEPTTLGEVLAKQMEIGPKAAVNELLGLKMRQTIDLKELLDAAEEKIEILNAEIRLLRNEAPAIDIAQCPFCGSKPKIQQAGFEIACGDYTCGVKPRARSNDLNTAISKWEGRV